MQTVNMLSRKQVVDLIMGELAYQDALPPYRTDGVRKGIEKWIVLYSRYARGKLLAGGDVNAHIPRKLAGIICHFFRDNPDYGFGIGDIESFPDPKPISPIAYASLLDSHADRIEAAYADHAGDTDAAIAMIDALKDCVGMMERFGAPPRA